MRQSDQYVGEELMLKIYISIIKFYKCNSALIVYKFSKLNHQEALSDYKSTPAQGGLQSSKA